MKRLTAAPVVMAICSRHRGRARCYRIPEIPRLRLCMRCLCWIIEQARVGLYQIKSKEW